jgi:hypothetical protein
MTQPTPEEIKRVCPEFDFVPEHTQYYGSIEHSYANCLRALAQSRLENEKLQGQLLGFRETLDFYSNIKNFGINHWNNNDRSDVCWSVTASDDELTEAYSPTSTGDFGIKAQEALENTDQAAEQAKAKFWNEAVRAVLSLEEPKYFDWIDIPKIKKLLKPEGGAA